MKAIAVTYCIDTSCLIAAWEERYPPENFPKFWDYLDRLIDEDRLRTPVPVHDETSKKSKELHSWLGQRPKLFVDLDIDIQREARALLTRYPRLVMQKKERFSADPFVIATAKVRGWVVVTEEKPTGNLNRPNIPDVCRDGHVEYLNLLQLIRAEAWLIS